MNWKTEFYLKYHLQSHQNIKYIAVNLAKYVQYLDAKTTKH